MATTDEILDLVPSIGQRAETYRFDLLDKNLALLDEVTVDRSSPPSIENNINRTIKRDMRNLVLAPGTYDDINFQEHRIRASLILENGDVLPLGVFLFVDDPSDLTSAGSTIVASLVDQTLIVDQGSPQTFSVPEHGAILPAIQALLSAAGIQPANMDIDVPPSKTVGGPCVWPAGTSRLQIVNDLASLAGCNSLFFSNAGIARIKAVVNLHSVDPAVTYEAGRNIIAGSVLRTNNLLTAPNRYIVVDSGVNVSPIVGVYDVPAAAPNSFERIGFYRTQVINEQGVPDELTAKTIAKAKAQADASDFEWLSFGTLIDPRLDTFDVVSFLDIQYRVQRWGPVTLKPGAVLPLDLRRVYEGE